jgi:hypothetical protein
MNNIEEVSSRGRSGWDQGWKRRGLSESSKTPLFRFGRLVVFLLVSRFVGKIICLYVRFEDSSFNYRIFVDGSLAIESLGDGNIYTSGRTKLAGYKGVSIIGFYCSTGFPITISKHKYHQ